ncbi:MAG: ElyC/SanA/YdcF family protein [Pseudomonadota bacterium]
MHRLIIGVSLAFVTWLVGLAIFITTLPAPASESAALTAKEPDGVVVYTGGGSRISAGMALFANGAGERLLISGVNPDTSRETLAGLWEGTPELFECCVDLGRQADSTSGNASEAAAWAAANKQQHIVLVTSEFHMPRSLSETRARMPDAAITPYAVQSGYLDEAGRPVSRDAWRKLAGEYNKFLLSRGKHIFSSISA